MRLHCSDITVCFEAGERRFTAIQGLSFETHESEFVSVIGPSGCGKTTLLRTIAGILAPTEGFVHRGGSESGGRNRGLMVYQEDSLFPWMTVMENAAFGLEMQGVGREERERRARELIERHGLSGHENAYPHQLSAGMKQRVAVIRAFLSEAGLLLMDEPFGALDSPTRRALQKDLVELWKRNRRPVVFVTHDVDEAIFLSDRVVVLSASPARVVGEVRIGLPREDRREAMLSEEFLRLKSSMLTLLEGNGGRAVAAGQEDAA